MHLIHINQYLWPMSFSKYLTMGEGDYYNISYMLYAVQWCIYVWGSVPSIYISSKIDTNHFHETSLWCHSHQMVKSPKLQTLFWPLVKLFKSSKQFHISCSFVSNTISSNTRNSNKAKSKHWIHTIDFSHNILRANMVWLEQ